MATRVQQEAVVTKSVKQESRVDARVEILNTELAQAQVKCDIESRRNQQTA